MSEGIQPRSHLLPPPPHFKLRHIRRGFVVLLLILFATFPRQAVQAQGSTPAQPTIDVGSGSTWAIVYWKEANDPSITKWQYQYKIGTGNWGAWADIPNSDARTYSYTQTGLSNRVAIQFKIRAVNANGAGPASSAKGSVPESLGITMSTASTAPIVEGNSGLKNVAITVMLSAAAPEDGLEVQIDNMATSTAGGKPVCSSQTTADDVCGPTTITIPGGTTSGTYTLSIIGDTVDEDNETVYLSAFAFGWAKGTIRLVIADDDEGSTATPVPPTVTHTPTGTRAPTATPVPPTVTHTPTGTRDSVAATSLQATATPVPTRIRLYQRRSHDDDHSVPTHTPVVRCPAPRRSL